MMEQKRCRKNNHIFTGKYCKQCAKERDRKKYERNKNAIIDRQKKYYETNKDEILKYKKEHYDLNRDRLLNDKKVYYLNNKEEVLSRSKNRYENNKENILEKCKEYRDNNKDKVYPSIRAWKQRKRKDPFFKLRECVSGSIFNALRKNSGSKNKKSCFKYLPYTIDELKEYIEDLFEPWMNWNNRGVYNLKTWDDNDQSTWVWQLDHIIPHSTFKYSSMEDEEFKKCWALSNLRPLSAKQNLKDGNRR